MSCVRSKVYFTTGMPRSMLIRPNGVFQETPTPTPTRGAGLSVIATGCPFSINWFDALQRADVDEGSTGQPDIGRNRQREAQLSRLRPDEPAAQAVTTDHRVRPRAAGFEAAQIVAAEEEPVDDVFLVAEIEQVPGTRRESDAPVRASHQAIPAECNSFRRSWCGHSARCRPGRRSRCRDAMTSRCADRACCPGSQA